MKEKLQEYALIAEIIGGIGIIASLIFVGLQIQQNSKISQVNAYQELTTQILHINSLNAENQDLSDITFKAIQGDELDEIEQFRLNQVFIQVIRHGDIAYLQYQEGYITQDQLDNTLGPLRGIFFAPAFNRTWEAIKPFVNSSYVNYIENNFIPENQK